jgi:hypothetical protein
MSTAVHARSSSMQDFREQGTANAAKFMRSELNKLAHLIPQPDRRKVSPRTRRGGTLGERQRGPTV